MSEVIKELKEQLGKFFNIVPGYYSFKAQIFKLIEELEQHDR